VGNKSDLDAEGKRAVSYETAKDFADQLGLTLIETSAKDATNVEKCFMKMASEIQKTYALPYSFFCFTIFLKFPPLLFRIADPGGQSGAHDEDTLIDFTKPPPSNSKSCRC
jgi:hypothetical protein